MDHHSWYVVQTRPQKENVAVGLLQQANVEAFLPKMRRIKRVIPLFPRYLFVHTNLADAYTHHMIRYTRGVTRILGDDTGPIAINPAVIETMRATTKQGSLIEQELLYAIGDTVMVHSGVLRDLVGIVEKNLPEAGRVRVLFRWMNRRMQADIDYRSIERVTKAEKRILP